MNINSIYHTNGKTLHINYANVTVFACILKSLLVIRSDKNIAFYDRCIYLIYLTAPFVTAYVHDRVSNTAVMYNLYT